MKMTLFALLFVISYGLLSLRSVEMKRPHIIMILADDLGWNDVSFHGSNQIPTPNIDKLAQEGIILNNYYVEPICTPSRAAILTGRHPIHTGMQQSVIYAPNAWGLGLNETLLPQYLKKQGYKTHAVGKWHLGFHAKEYLPTSRGFDSYYGYYLGWSDYWSHSAIKNITNDPSMFLGYWGLDLHRNEEPVWDQWGNYSTEIFTAEAEDRIATHDSSSPLFLYVSYQAVHSALPHDPLQAPKEWVDKYKHIKHPKRRIYAAVVGYMDYGIGRIHKALEKKGILDNSIIIFTSDNGGAANGFNRNWASNWPLRGVKASVFEGGVRAAGLVYSKLFRHPGRVSTDLMHITDWLPTLVKLAGGEVNKEVPLDGFDMWGTLQDKEPSPRTEVLLNIDDLFFRNQALRVGDWKILKAGGLSRRWGRWLRPPGMTSNETEEEEEVVHFNSDAELTCSGSPPKKYNMCVKRFCLFNIVKDPCEYDDLSSTFPDVLSVMEKRLNEYRAGMVPPHNNLTVDPLCNPKLHGGVWGPWVTL